MPEDQDAKSGYHPELCKYPDSEASDHNEVPVDGAIYNVNTQ